MCVCVCGVCVRLGARPRSRTWLAPSARVAGNCSDRSGCRQRRRLQKRTQTRFPSLLSVPASVSVGGDSREKRPRAPRTVFLAGDLRPRSSGSWHALSNTPPLGNSFQALDRGRGRPGKRRRPLANAASSRSASAKFSQKLNGLLRFDLAGVESALDCGAALCVGELAVVELTFGQGQLGASSRFRRSARSLVRWFSTRSSSSCAHASAAASLARVAARQPSSSQIASDAAASDARLGLRTRAAFFASRESGDARGNSVVLQARPLEDVEVEDLRRSHLSRLRGGAEETRWVLWSSFGQRPLQLAVPKNSNHQRQITAEVAHADVGNRGWQSRR